MLFLIPIESHHHKANVAHKCNIYSPRSQILGGKKKPEKTQFENLIHKNPSVTFKKEKGLASDY